MDKVWIDRLENLKLRKKELEERLNSHEILSDRDRLIQLSREYDRITEILHLYERYQALQSALNEAQTIIDTSDDDELIELARQELSEKSTELKQVEHKLLAALAPRDKYSDRNVIMELRAAAGGEEAALFARDLFRMYARYIEQKGWQLELIDEHKSDLGGYKQVIFAVKGKDVYQHLRYESGVHRVQRIPVTESGGRIHTSTVTVAVLPEADEIEVRIDPKDIKLEFFYASGPGGQNVNKVATAVRITHIPTGIVVTSQEQRSQYQNRMSALTVLRAKLLERMRKERDTQLQRERKQQIGEGERSEKIRTYNFPQNRVTDHRIGLTLYQLDEILEGNLDPIIDALRKADLMRQLDHPSACTSAKKPS